jgi:hypothetical protein
MSFPVLAQARDSLNKAYVAVQNWNTNPAHIPLPDTINTKRRHLTHEQIAARYLKSIEGNTDIDINKIPKMSTRNRIDFELPITDEKLSNEITPENQKRQIYACWKGHWYFEAKEGVESGTHLEFNWIGNLKNPHACTDGTSQFIVCSDQYLGETIRPQWIHNDVILDYRNVTSLYNDYGWCLPMWEYLECPTPATEIDDINQQIDTTIKQNRQVRIYLNETDLNNYLEFRNETGELENFNYILISDKPSTPEKPPAPENSPEENFGYPFSPDKKDWGAIIAGAVGGGFAALGVMALGGYGLMKYRARTAANTPASTTTTVPAHVVASVQTGLSTSPGNSTAPVSNSPTTTTTSAAAVGVSTPPTTTAANSSGITAQQSSSSSDDDSSSVAIDIPPAGHEDD